MKFRVQGYIATLTPFERVVEAESAASAEFKVEAFVKADMRASNTSVDEYVTENISRIPDDVEVSL